MNEFMKVFLLGGVWCILSCNDGSSKLENLNSPAGSNVRSTSAINQIVFGVYCGECVNNCAIMYRYINGGDKNSYSIDYSDSFFNKSDVTFDSEMVDNFQFNIGDEIILSIPDTLLLSESASERHGCPDCTDGCGIYFELTKDMKKQKFYIDYQTSELSGDIKKFAELLKDKINLLRKRNGI